MAILYYVGSENANQMWYNDFSVGLTESIVYHHIKFISSPVDGGKFPQLLLHHTSIPQSAGYDNFFSSFICCSSCRIFCRKLTCKRALLADPSGKIREQRQYVQGIQEVSVLRWAPHKTMERSSRGWSEFKIHSSITLTFSSTLNCIPQTYLMLCQIFLALLQSGGSSLPDLEQRRELEFVGTTEFVITSTGNHAVFQHSSLMQALPANELTTTCFPVMSRSNSCAKTFTCFSYADQSAASFVRLACVDAYHKNEEFNLRGPRKAPVLTPLLLSGLHHLELYPTYFEVDSFNVCVPIEWDASEQRKTAVFGWTQQQVRLGWSLTIYFFNFIPLG